ncbi:capsule biosynthesis protein [Kordiimonas laminariae]|uniref:capsule biosynthesis protein n=1 Tax=Kordiimonas laminariae TaxID=2917717 RepID=UPI001FF596E7|nr:capsular biosynthesis protein [Kordiimonas laminariae]MCK0067995.1 capsular biosynthesis protein [Kordiimonas laminariae]
MSQPVGKSNAVKPMSVLFLQGLASPFYKVLADKLTDAGATCHRVNYCGGDIWFGKFGRHKIETTRFQQPHEYLPVFYEELIKEKRITDVILFGDCRPIHQPVFPIAEKLNVRVHVFEEGYTRPNYVTLETGGTNANSPLPHSKEAVEARAKTLKETGALDNQTDRPTLPNPMGARVRMDLMFHLSNILCCMHFRNYQTHRPEKVSAEAKGWVNRFIRKQAYKKANSQALAYYAKPTDRYFMVPLQLNSDFQIRNHSDYESVPDFIDEVIASFAKAAPNGMRLLFKNHPLDNGMIDYRNLIELAALRHGVTGLIDYVEGGDLDKILKRAEGVVLINSTVGYAALKQNAPIKVMGRAIYDMKGLTFQGPLDDFWPNAKAPDTLFINNFLRVVRADSQLYGDFFTPTGIELAASAAVTRLMNRKKQ